MDKEQQQIRTLQNDQNLISQYKGFHIQQFVVYIVHPKLSTQNYEMNCKSYSANSDHVFADISHNGSLYFLKYLGFFIKAFLKLI